jgi:CRISPR/Cas system-associated exonuclease Cas4 (RecB family)
MNPFAHGKRKKNIMSDTDLKSGYTRVTEALGFFSGLKFVDPQILKNAAERGSVVHRVCDAIIKGLGFEEKDVDPLGGYINSFKDWGKNKQFLPTPDRFYCDIHKITGEIDGLYLDGNDLVLFDIKTSVNENITWYLQGSAYAYLLRQHGYNIARIEFIKLNKDGKPCRVYVYEEDFPEFVKCLEMHRKYFSKFDKENLLEKL